MFLHSTGGLGALQKEQARVMEAKRKVRAVRKARNNGILNYAREGCRKLSAREEEGAPKEKED